LGNRELNLNAAERALERLEAGGLLGIQGPYVELLPPLLANRLAASFLKGRATELAALLATLKPRPRNRLVGRLAALQSEEVTIFSNDLFEAGGPVSTLDALLEHPHLLDFQVSSAPSISAAFIEGGLRSKDLTQRLDIRGASRRSIVDALQELTYRTAATN